MKSTSLSPGMLAPRPAPCSDLGPPEMSRALRTDEGLSPQERPPPSRFILVADWRVNDVKSDMQRGGLIIKE